MKPNIAKAKRHLAKIRESIAKRNLFAGMTAEEVIEKIRKDRERIWEAKLAARP